MGFISKFCRTRMFRQGLLVIGGLVAVLIIALLIAGFLYAQKGKVELAEIQSEIRDAGGRLTFEDYDLEPGEYKSDGFLLLEQELAELNRHYREARETTGHKYRKLEVIGKEYAITGTTPQDWNYNGGLSWEQVHEAYLPTQRSWNKCLEIIKTNQVTYRNDYLVGIDTKFEHIKSALDVCRVGAELSFLAVQRKAPEQAIIYLQNTKQLNDKIAGSQPYTLIEALVSMTQNGILIEQARQIFASSRATSTEHQVLKQLFQGEVFLMEFDQAMAGERVLFQAPIWDNARSNMDVFLDALTQTNPQEKLLWLESIKFCFRLIYLPFLIDADQARATRLLWNTQLAAQRVYDGELSYLSAFKPVKIDIEELQEANTFKRFLTLFSSFSTPSVALSADRMIFAETQQRQMLIAIQLENFKFKHGNYPVDLAQILLGSKVDLSDPMTLEPMKYQLESDGSYTLYSVGMNGSDDGAPLISYQEKDTKGRRYRAYTAPDWIWPKVVSE